MTYIHPFAPHDYSVPYSKPFKGALFSVCFCLKCEALYVTDLKSAARVPNMGKGDGFKFELAKGCKPNGTQR